MRCLSIKTVLTTAALIAAFGFANSSAQAGLDGPLAPAYGLGFHGDLGYGHDDYALDTCHDDLYVPRCSYRKVIDYELRTETYCDYIVKYTSCGRAYKVPVHRTRTIRVPVERLVKVCY